MHKAKELSKEEHQREVEKELTGEYSEGYEFVFFKLYKSQIPIVEKAIETAALMWLHEEKPHGLKEHTEAADDSLGT